MILQLNEMIRIMHSMANCSKERIVLSSDIEILARKRYQILRIPETVRLS